MNIIGKPSAIGDLSAIFAAAEVNRCSSPAISPAAAAPMSEVIDRTKVKKSPTAAINGRRRMLDPHNVRAATRDKRPPAKNRGPSRTANAGQRKANVANRAGRANVANRAGIRPGQGRANFANRGGINRGMGGLRAQAGGLRIAAADLAVAVLAVEVVVLVVEVVASVAVVAALGARISGSSTTSSLSVT